MGIVNFSTTSIDEFGLIIEGSLSSELPHNSLTLCISNDKGLLATKLINTNGTCPFFVRLDWKESATFFYDDIELHIDSSIEKISLHIHEDILIGGKWNKKDFFVKKVRSPGSRLSCNSTINFLSWHFYNSNILSDPELAATALIVLIYRLLEVDTEFSPSQARFFLEQGSSFLTTDQLHVNSRWGFSLRMALFYLEFSYFDKELSVKKITDDLNQLNNTCAAENYPNIFKIAFVLSALYLLASKKDEIEKLLLVLKSFLLNAHLWAIPANFFASLDRKNMVSNYHEIFKMLMLLDADKYKLDWVNHGDRKIDTRYIGDPGKTIIRKLFQEHKIDHHE